MPCTSEVPFLWRWIVEIFENSNRGFHIQKGRLKDLMLYFEKFQVTNMCWNWLTNYLYSIQMVFLSKTLFAKFTYDFFSFMNLIWLARSFFYELKQYSILYHNPLLADSYSKNLIFEWLSFFMNWNIMLSHITFTTYQ